MLWNSTLECGIASIDEQHKELFRQVDILLDNSNRDRIPETLNFLGQYVVKHFAMEEAMHNRSRYPKTMAHKKLHTDFIATYKGLRNEYETSGHNLAVLMKINKVAVSWLKEHIMMQDKDFAKFYRQLGVS